MVSENKPITGPAFAGRSARACDNCIKKRARWYCAADDAFLCQSCDSSLHSSANHFSPPHQHLRLKSTTLRNISLPFVPQGFICKKPRTPRRRRKRKMKNKNHGKFKSVSKIMNSHYLRLVPEVDQFSDEENEKEEEEEQLVHRVPVFNPTLNDAVSADISKTLRLQTFANKDHELSGDDLVVDVERFLDDEEGIGMEELGIRNLNDCNKTEEELGNQSRKTFLRLDYDGVLSAWEGRQSPWITGRSNLAGVYCSGGIGEMAEDGGREARVWRYREKRRRRLYSTKIRYEVRKVNAEKRPRIKGRFVKRIPQTN